MNSSLSEIGKFPIKLHRVPQQSQCNYGKGKLSSISKKITKLVALALKVPQQEIVSDQTTRESDSKQANKSLETMIR